jgi:hypothetical protein
MSKLNIGVFAEKLFHIHREVDTAGLPLFGQLPVEVVKNS